MALAKALVKDFENQIPSFSLDDLPTLEDRRAFIAEQIAATSKVIYRTITDLRAARAYAAHKDPEYNEIAKQRFQESIATLKAYKVTLAVLVNIAKELDNSNDQRDYDSQE